MRKSESQQCGSRRNRNSLSVDKRENECIVADMKRAGVSIVLLVSIAMAVPIFAGAFYVPTLYTNANYIESYHEAPQSFTLNDDGSFTGLTVGGRIFSQANVANDYNVRLQKFVIDEAFFYVSDKGDIYADNDLTALSIYLATAV